MSKDKKTVLRFYTITDYEQEEQWLQEMYRGGWKPNRFVPPCFYTFERCEPADMVFRLEFNDMEITSQSDYLRMLDDYGWSYLFSCMSWRYYCKPADTKKEANELFTDNVSKLEMLNQVVRWRLLPFIVIFFCCVLPNVLRDFSDSGSVIGWNLVWTAILLLYSLIMIHCLLGLKRLRSKYGVKR